MQTAKLPFRERLGIWVDSDQVQRFVIGLIVFNSLVIGLESYKKKLGIPDSFIDLIDEVILVVFALELLIKIYSFRWKFFKDNWNNFDFIIVIFSLLPATGIFSVLRTLRILRALRLMKKIPKLRLIIDALFHAIPSIGWIVALLLLIFYTFAVITTNLFGQAFPEWFGTLGASMYTLFQVMTLESWSMGIVRPIMEKFPYAFMVFIPFILMASYTALNIFIAVVVNAMNELYDHEHSAEKEEQDQLQMTIQIQTKALHEELLVLKEEIQALRRELSAEKEAKVFSTEKP